MRTSIREQEELYKHFVGNNFTRTLYYMDAEKVESVCIKHVLI